MQETSTNNSGLRQPGVFNGYRIHLVGVGGSGMFGAAKILLRLGAVISGSDMKQFAGAGELVENGATIHIPHDRANLRDDISLVVRSAAVPDTNPEIVAAREKSIPVICYAELLGEITRSRLAVSVSGTHGKSTTSSLTTYLFHRAGLDPSFIFGADCRQLGGSSGVGGGEHFIVESCEYGRSFLHMRPHSAAILNIEADHLDYYRDLDDIVSAFGTFASRVSIDGLLVVNHDDLLAKQAARQAACRVETFGLGPGADWRATSLRSSRSGTVFKLLRHGQEIMNCSLRLAGVHNVCNALAATALAYEGGASFDDIEKALATFDGISRRMTVCGTRRGVTIVDDFAHHPTEIRMTLSAVRSRFSPRKTWVVFQPHQASRTRQLMDDFSRAFADADVVLVPDIFSVRDTDEDRLSVASSRLVDRIRETGIDSRYFSSLDAVCEHLDSHIAEGDVVVTMGAGDVWKVANGLVERVS